MRCTKCGYVSFDYLTECKKCGTNLDGAREGLGFTASKPVIPFFLGSLLKDYVKPADQEEPGQAEIGGPSFDFGEELDAPGLHGDYKPGSAQYVAEKADIGTSGSKDAEDFNLLDISDEELELLVTESETGSGLEMDPAVFSDSEKTKAAAALSGSGEKTAGGLIPRVDVASLPGLSGSGAGGVPPAAEADSSTGVAGEEDDTLQIELSENDLQALLSELEGAPRKETGGGGAGDKE